jgi:hypothetical protein
MGNEGMTQRRNLPQKRSTVEDESEDEGGRASAFKSKRRRRNSTPPEQPEGHTTLSPSLKNGDLGSTLVITEKRSKSPRFAGGISNNSPGNSIASVHQLRDITQPVDVHHRKKKKRKKSKAQKAAAARTDIEALKND